MTIAPKLPLAAVDPVDEVVIRTERLMLRPLRHSDVGLIEHYAADRRLAEQTRTIPHPLPPGAIEAWVGHVTGLRPAPAAAKDGVGETRVWVIDGAEAKHPEVMGILTLHHVTDAQCELEFWIGPGLWNSGFATEAVSALIAANPCQCRSLVAEAFQDNPGSARVLINCGFSYLGDAESWSVARNALVPTWTYARPMT